MSKYIQTLSKHRRLTILRFLAESPEYTSNASILMDVCNDLGVTSTRDQLLGDITWLTDQGMITKEDHNGFIIATATGLGVEIAQGLTRHDGVQRPRAGK